MHYWQAIYNRYWCIKKIFYMLQEKFVKELDDAKRELKDLKAELEQQLSEKVNQKFF